MSTHPEVVNELRMLFKRGATPSRLIRLIAARHKDEAHLHSLIQDYFLEAFGVPIVRGLNPADDYRDLDLRHAFLNEHVVHEILEKLPYWDRLAASSSANGQEPWFKSLKASDDMSRLDQAKATPIPELAQCWAKLSPAEQEHIHMLTATARGQWEAVKILARLAEALQQEVSKMEGRLEVPAKPS
jgi:hypothetical protein